ncbi:DUF4132 domain-containing protein [Actinomadura sp. WMMB 499]|uniref:DUF4132 domain-containing protein n=1 Tax=Actinomadura sp. WMMB 499 TaxID=1219491 RepID=UPI00159D6D89|nr:DUF4132 domain-containing protein [Actinomadura sp. WMMB 499]
MPDVFPLDAPALARAPWTAPFRALADPGAAGLVRHLRSLSGPRPAQTWRRTCVALADAAGARAALAETVRILAEDAPLCSEHHGPSVHRPYADENGDEFAHHEHYLVHDDHTDLARGIVWAAALTVPDVVPHLAVLAPRALGGGRTPCGEPPAGHEPRRTVWVVGAEAVPDAAPVSGPAPLAECLKVAGAAVNALGAADGPAGLEALTGLRGRIGHRGLRKQIDAALRTAGQRLGLTPDQAAERGVPAHGLGPDGSTARALGAHTARLAVEDAATVRITFTGPDGRASRTAPVAVRDGFAAELAELKALAKEVRGTLANERRRVEGLLSAGRTWTFGEWRAHYRDHPVTGAVVRGLIWEFQGTDGVWRALAPGAIPEEPAHVRLWHPVRATVDEVRAWREHVTAAGVRQPFKQAFREVYLLTPAEEGTGTYSNRFAGHIVQYDRLYALIRERGWQANYLGPFDGGDGEARGEFAGGRWRACCFHDRAGAGHAATDQVRFERRDGRHWREASLAEVPPAVFSEAMRDVDLFVSVTSIAADPEWADRGDERHRGYWHEHAFGELTATAEVRRAALERVLPRTKIADRCTLDGRFLVVRGGLRTYRIHLGSANVLMEPDGAYLCIVRGRPGGRVLLPFEDERLSLILSKAFLLAADGEITDPSVRSQITR